MSNIVNVARMQLINKWTFLGIPMIVLVSSTALTLAIWAMIPKQDGVTTLISGSGQAVMWYFLALGIQSLTYTFPFSQAMSVSRRTFYLGTLGLFAAIALGFAILYYVLGLIETATNGWGMGGQLFALGWIAENNAVIQVLFYFVLMVLLFMIGFWFATVYLRWKTTGMLVTWISLGLLLVAFIGFLTMNEMWMDFWGWLGGFTVPGLLIGLSGLCVLLAAGSYLTLRRATS